MPRFPSKLWAHRMLPGTPGVTENTSNGLQACLEKGYNVEFDVQTLRASTDLIIFHDETLDRLVDPACSVQGSVSQLTPSALNKVVLIGKARIPMLSEALETISRWLAAHPEDDLFRMNIELKSVDSAAPTLSVLAKGLSEGIIKPDHVVLSSFHKAALIEAHRILQTHRLSIPLAVLTERDWQHAVQIAKQVNADRLHLAAEVATPYLIDTLHRLGFQVAFYTVDEPQLMCQLLSWGADALFTNRPDRLYSQLESVAA